MKKLLSAFLFLFSSLASAQNYPNPKFSGFSFDSNSHAQAATGNLQYLHGAAGSVSRSLTSKFQDVLNAKDFGATCNGSGIGDLIGIQAAITVAQAASGGLVNIPAGNCVVNGTININSGNVQISGAGRGQTTITQTNTAANTFSFGGTTFDSGLSDLTINQNGTPTAGYGVLQTNGTGDIRIRNVRIQGTFYGAGQSNSGVNGVLQLDNVDFSQTANDAMRINGNSQFFATNVTSYQNTAGNCLNMLQSWGSYVSNLTCQSSAGNGINIAPATGATVTDAYFVNTEVDNTSSTGIAVDSTGGGSIYGLIFNSTRVGFGSGAGWLFNGTNTANITVSNSRSEKNVQDGIKITNAQNSIFTNNQILGNSATGAGYNGINVAGGTGLSLVGNVVGGFFGTGNNQAYGITVQSGFSGVMQISHNNLQGNSTGAINNASASTSITISDNIGYNVFSIAGNQVYPSLWGNHSYYNLIVPNTGTAGWNDNVMTVQNNSASASAQGNAAFRFVDNVNGYERAAIGYSRVNTGTIGGWIPDIAYVEVGNQTAGDPDDTDFAVVVTHQTGAVHFPNTTLVAFRVVASTGDINMNTQGSGAVNVGSIGVVTPFTIGMQNVLARFRERDNVNNISLTTNLTQGGAQDDATRPSWELSMGGTDDELHVGRIAAGGTSPNKTPSLLAVSSTGKLSPSGGIQLPTATVSGLPTCNSGSRGLLYMVTDASSPTYNSALTGGSSTVTLAACNGSAWTAH